MAGVTNPSAPSLGPYNQTGDSRLISVNSYDDWCIFAPEVPGDTIGDQEERVVSYCTKLVGAARSSF